MGIGVNLRWKVPVKEFGVLGLGATTCNRGALEDAGRSSSRRPLGFLVPISEAA